MLAAHHATSDALLVLDLQCIHVPVRVAASAWWASTSATPITTTLAASWKRACPWLLARSDACTRPQPECWATSAVACTCMLPYAIFWRSECCCQHELLVSRHQQREPAVQHECELACVHALMPSVAAQTPCQKYWPHLLKMVEEGTLTPDMVQLILRSFPNMIAVSMVLEVVAG